MDDLFEKLKSEEPVNRNIKVIGEVPINEVTTMSKTKKKGKERKLSDNNTRQQPQKVPTKGEKKYIGNESTYKIKGVQVQLEKIDIKNYTVNQNDKVSTKAEKKLFNEADSLLTSKITPRVKRSTRSVDVQNVTLKRKSEPSSTKPAVSSNMRSQNVKKPALPEATSSNKRLQDAKKETASEVLKKPKVVQEPISPKPKGERKRKSTTNTSSLSEPTTRKNKKEANVIKTNTTIAKQMSELKNCSILLERIDLTSVVVKNISDKSINKSHKRERKSRKATANVNEAQKNVSVAESTQIMKKGGRQLKNAGKLSETPKITNPRKSKIQTKTASPEFKIKLPLLGKHRYKNRQTKKDEKPTNDNINSEESLIKMYGKRIFDVRVKLRRCDVTALTPMKRVEVANDTPVALKNKKAMNVSFVEEVEFIGDTKQIDNVDMDATAKKEEVVPFEDAATETMEALVVTPTSTGSIADDTEVLNSTNIEIEVSIPQIETDVLKPQIETEASDKEEVLLEEIPEASLAENILETDTHEDEEEEKLKRDEKLSFTLIEETEATENKVLHNDKNTSEICEKDVVEQNIFEEPEEEMLTLMHEDDCADTIETQICNNGHSLGMELSSEHSNDGVIKNDVMMNGLGFSNDINEPILRKNLGKGQSLELIESEDEYGVAYSPSSFRSAKSDMETHAEKRSETKLSDEAASVHENMDFDDTEISATVEVSSVNDVDMFTSSSVDVELPAADDVSSLLADIEVIPTKSPLEVDKLNASISFVDDASPQVGELTDNNSTSVCEL